jgi:hypothetical protein
MQSRTMWSASRPRSAGERVKALKSIGRFINRLIMDMAADRPGGGMATKQERVGTQD